MILLAAMICSLLAVVAALAAFILLEALAIKDRTDGYYTFSTYWHWAKEKHTSVKFVLNAAAVLLCALLVAAAIFLFLDLVLEVI